MLRSLARREGLCDKWYGEWKPGSTDDELIAKYLDGISFCMHHDYPKPELVRRLFDADTLERHGVYVDARGVGLTERGHRTLVFLGECEARMLIGGYAVVNVYVRHQSHLWVQASDHARVFVYAYDGCDLILQATDNGRVRAIRHGDDVRTVTVGAGVTLRAATEE